MSYWDIASMARDLDLQSRIYACVAQETGSQDRTVDFLVICGAPGWAEAWASALASDDPLPGKDPAVITDGMILSSVQAWLSSEAEGDEVQA
jgi:hypothetical protein